VLTLPTRFPEYLVAAILIILAPGPSVLFAIARAITWGRANAVAAVAGNALGMLTLSILVAFGLGPILQASKIAFLGIQILGGAYLLYLGVEAIRNSKLHAEAMVSEGELAGAVGQRPSQLRSIRDGFWVGALNPKGLVFFAAILPQFLDRSPSANATGQLLAMGLTFAILAFVLDGTWATLAGTVRNWLATTPSRLVFLRQVGGVVMLLLGFFTFTSAL